MSEIEISSDELEDNSELDVTTKKNMLQFQQMIKLCRKNKMVPLKYIEDMDKMYNTCSYKQKNSTDLSNLILKGIENISSNNKNSFQYAANVYNELLKLSKKEHSSKQTENDVASTSSITTGLENGTINESNEIFKEFIDKCYENPNFPNSNIDVIDKLYKSLPSEFVDSKHFILLLKEVNQMIWPDSSITLYVHVEHVYEQLQQFKTSMKIQDRAISVENKEINNKKLIKLKKLQVALKKVRKQIKNLDEKEMDLNDDDDFDLNSAYILKDRYEKRAIEIYKRMCKLRDEPDYLEEPQLRFKQTENSLVNKTIEKFYNINKIFPDYFEIYTLLQLLNKKKTLGWTEAELKNISRDAFHKLGTQLKLQRLNEYFGRLENITMETKDPADTNMELKIKLDKSNKKFNADLNAVTEKFEKKQEYAEETEGSNLSNSECENSSEDDSNKNIYVNKNPNGINNISIKRKRSLSNGSEKNEPKLKSQKTIYMESFDLTPLDIPNNPTDKGTKEDIEIVPDKIIVPKNINNEANKSTIINSEEISKTMTDNINNSDENSENNIEVDKCSNNESNGVLVIDEDECIKVNTDETILKESQENINNDSAITIDSEDEPIITEPIITEPEVIINECEDSVKDTIEINEFDGPDVIITTSTPNKVPVQNKKSIESIIKSMNFDKKYKWNQQQSIQKPYNSLSSRVPHNHNLGNPNHDSNHQLVNRWVMNNVRPPKPNVSNSKQLYRTPSNQRAQPKFQKSTSQTERQFTQRLSNTVQQQRNFMNSQSVLQQQVTTMTTTTTVRQIVQQSSESVRRRVNSSNNQVRRPVSSRYNVNDTPELIELD